MIRVKRMSIGYPLSPAFTRTIRIGLWAVLAGVLIVIAPMPINWIVFFAWIYLLRRRARARRGKELAKTTWPADEIDGVAAPAKLGFIRPRTVVAIQVSIVSIIIVVAASLPCKYLDRCLNGEVNLPKTTMTLGELTERARGSHDLHLHLSFEPAEEAIVVRFPRNRMKVVEIIETIEQQTRFRRMISKCANESTVLWGVNAFMISMVPRDPRGHHDSTRIVVQAFPVAGAPGRPQGSIDGSGEPHSRRDLPGRADTEAAVERAR
jgi:hypothetical protein